jgi:hypothetical protein
VQYGSTAPARSPAEAVVTAMAVGLIVVSIIIISSSSSSSSGIS